MLLGVIDNYKNGLISHVEVPIAFTTASARLDPACNTLPLTLSGLHMD